jgi:hypothetical protein
MNNQKYFIQKKVHDFGQRARISIGVLQLPTSTPTIFTSVTIKYFRI